MTKFEKPLDISAAVTKDWTLHQWREAARKLDNELDFMTGLLASREADFEPHGLEVG